MNGHSGRLSLAILLWLTLTLDVSAETVAQTARKWGLLGPWSLDCSQPPNRDQGAVLAYELGSGDRVVLRRNFGDARDENEVVGAEVSSDGMLNLRAFFPSLKQTREYGLMMQPDGSMRAMYNRNQKGDYTIKDGKFTVNGNATRPQQKCIARS